MESTLTIKRMIEEKRTDPKSQTYRLMPDSSIRNKIEYIPKPTACSIDWIGTMQTIVQTYNHNHQRMATALYNQNNGLDYYDTVYRSYFSIIQFKRLHRKKDISETFNIIAL